MKNAKSMLVCSILAAALLLNSAIGSIGFSLARVTASDSWTGQISGESGWESREKIFSNLLTAEGQTVKVSGQTGQVYFSLYGAGLEDGAVSVEVSEPERLSVSVSEVETARGLSERGYAQGGEERTFLLTLTRWYPQEEPEDTPPAAGEEPEEGTDVGAGETPEDEAPAQPEPETEDAEGTVALNPEIEDAEETADPEPKTENAEETAEPDPMDADEMEGAVAAARRKNARPRAAAEEEPESGLEEEPEDTPAPEPENPQPDDDGEEPDDGTDSGNDGEELPEPSSGDPEEPDEPSGDPEEPEPDDNGGEPDDGTGSGNDGEEPDDGTGSGDNGEEPPEPTDKETEGPGIIIPVQTPVRFTVRWTDGEYDLSADFIAAMETEQNRHSGALAWWPEHWSQSAPVWVGTGAEAVTLSAAKGFPAMTRYTVNGHATVLYNGGAIELPAFSVAAIELPDGSFGEMRWIDGAGNSYSLQETEPVAGYMPEPLVLGTGETALPIISQVGQAMPQVTVERLTKALAWTPAGEFLWDKTEDGEWLTLDAGGAPAGTYRLTVEWAQNGYVFCRLEQVFFVRYERYYETDQ